MAKAGSRLSRSIESLRSWWHEKKLRRRRSRSASAARKFWSFKVLGGEEPGEEAPGDASGSRRFHQGSYHTLSRSWRKDLEASNSARGRFGRAFVNWWAGWKKWPKKARRSCCGMPNMFNIFS